MRDPTARRRKATGMRWFVTKTIRYPTLPYGGPTWDVIDGKPRWFKTESAARKVAKEMTSYNPVGFSAAEIPAGWKAGKYPWFAPDNEERSNPMARRRKATGYVREKIRAHAARRNGDYSQTSDDELVEIYTGEKAGNREEALVEIKKRGVLDDYAIDLSLEDAAQQHLYDMEFERDIIETLETGTPEEKRNLREWLRDPGGSSSHWLYSEEQE